MKNNNQKNSNQNKKVKIEYDGVRCEVPNEPFWARTLIGIVVIAGLCYTASKKIQSNQDQ